LYAYSRESFLLQWPANHANKRESGN
jgi:hypothetical protein